VGGVWEVCQPRSVRVCLIYVFVEGLVERLRLGQFVHLAPETKADQGGHSKAARSPSRTCAGAACLIGLLCVGLEDPEEGLAAISRRVTASHIRWEIHPQRVERFQSCTD
jgi:hypothetical protein